MSVLDLSPGHILYIVCPTTQAIQRVIANVGILVISTIAAAPS